VTGPELAKRAAEAIGATSSGPTASHTAPPDMTGTPAVVIAPAEPWIAYPRLGARPVTRWEVRLIAGRWEQENSLEAVEAAYHALVAELHTDPTLVGIDPLSPPFAEDIGGTTYLVAAATITTTN
jgi:hypothetical protein